MFVLKNDAVRLNGFYQCTYMHQINQPDTDTNPIPRPIYKAILDKRFL